MPFIEWKQASAWITKAMSSTNITAGCFIHDAIDIEPEGRLVAQLLMAR